MIEKIHALGCVLWRFASIRVLVRVLVAVWMPALLDVVQDVALTIKALQRRVGDVVFFALINVRYIALLLDLFLGLVGFDRYCRS
jgi:hypothetical protein